MKTADAVLWALGPMWSVWNRKPTYSLRDACFLLMGAHPLSAEVAEKEIERGKIYSSELLREDISKIMKIMEVIDIAVENLEENGGTLKVFKDTLGDKQYVRVRVEDFIVWAKSVGYEVPEQLKFNGSVEKNDSGKDLEKAYILIAAMLKVLKNNNNRGNWSQDLLINEIEKMGIYGLGKTNISTIFSKANKKIVK